MKIQLSLLGLLLALATASASAQDMSRVYLRGDVGWAFANGASIGDNTIGPPSFANLCEGGAPNVCGFEVDDIGDSVSLAAGVGYRFTDNFRMDLTGGFRPSFELDDSILSAFGGQDTHRADIDTTTIMFAGYYDFSIKDSKVKPYIGGGLGWSWNDISTTTVTNSVSGLRRTHGGDTENDFAWQFSAGVGIPLKGRGIVDIGYKYVDVGDLDSGPTTVSGSFPGFAFGPFPFNGVSGDVSFHEVSIGIRY